MIALEALRMAFQGVLTNRLRSLLTMLGITIGVAAVIILVAVGHGSVRRGAAADRDARHERPHASRPAASAASAAAARSGGTQSQVTQLTMKDVKALQSTAIAPDVKSRHPGRQRASRSR